RMGWRVVSPRLFRRWNADRVRAERGVQARFADTILGGALPGRTTRPRRARHGLRSSTSGAPRRTTRLAAHSAVPSDVTRSWLYQRLRAWRSRERRPVHARRALDGDRAGPARSRRRGD